MIWLKIKNSRKKSYCWTIGNKIENITAEKRSFFKYWNKVSELLDAIKLLIYLFQVELTAFEQKSANTSGDSVTFDAADVKIIK